MAKRVFGALGIVLAVSLVALVSFAAGASGGSAGADPNESGESFMQRLHSMAYQMHQHGTGHGHQGAGGGNFWQHMGELVKQLELSQEQTARLEAIHETLASQPERAHEAMVETHAQLIEKFEQGYIEPDAIQPMIDQHLAEIQTRAYAVTDELLGLVNSLDARQREILLAHLKGDHAGHGL